MTPQEKWERLTNPKTIQDYGVYMTWDEIKQVPEAYAAINPYVEWRKMVEKESDEMCALMGQLGSNMSDTIDKIFMESIHRESQGGSE